jgi:hypothetical protein
MRDLNRAFKSARKIDPSLRYHKAAIAGGDSRRVRGAGALADKGGLVVRRIGSGLIEVEQLQQRMGRVANAELPFPLDEGELSRVPQNEPPVRGRMPFAWMPLNATDDLGEPDNAPQQQDRRQPHSEVPFDFIARHVVSALRCVNENWATIARRPSPVLDIRCSARN